MKKNQASLMAEGITIARVRESRKPCGERICYDPLARQLISPLFNLIGILFADRDERKNPGGLGFLVARCRYMDDTLQECVNDGIQQLVILGAGLDSRAYRFEQLKNKVKVFEVDTLASQLAKQKKLRKIFGDLPEYVTFVPVDFNEETLQKLFDFGYNRQLKTLFISEGVVYYLTPEAVDRTLEFVVKNSISGSSIVFDYLYLSVLNANHKRDQIGRLQLAKKFTGEGLTFGIEKGKVKDFLRERGFTHILNVTSEDLKKLYFTGVNQSRTVASIYAIVRADVK
jgi:methyltransferase (TIGR00027 family)